MEAELVNKILFLIQDEDTQLLSVKEIEISPITVIDGDCSWFNVLDSFMKSVNKFKEELPKNLILVAHSHLWPGYFHFDWNVYSILSLKIDTNFERGTDPFCDYRRMLLEYFPYINPNCIGHLYYQIECLSRYFTIDLKALYKSIDFVPTYNSWEELFNQAIILNNNFVQIVTSNNPLNRTDYSYLE